MLRLSDIKDAFFAAIDVFSREKVRTACASGRVIRFWILDFGFWISRKQTTNRKSKI
jgi:hypothetical protein